MDRGQGSRNRGTAGQCSVCCMFASTCSHHGPRNAHARRPRVFSKASEDNTAVLKRGLHSPGYRGPSPGYVSCCCSLSVLVTDEQVTQTSYSKGEGDGCTSLRPCACIHAAGRRLRQFGAVHPAHGVSDVSNPLSDGEKAAPGQLANQSDRPLRVWV